MRHEYITVPFEVKDADEKTGIIRGHAASFKVDQGDDQILPGAFLVSIASKRGRWPILADHDPRAQIGWNKSAKEDDRGLLVEGLLDIANNQKAKEKHSLAKMGLENGCEVGLSIGYTPVQFDFVQEDGKVTSERTWRRGEIRRLKEIRLWEYSLVTFPMNEDALVSGAKSWMDRMSNGGSLEDLTKFFVETMRGRSYSDSQVRKAVQDLLGPAATAKDPELDLQSSGATLDDIIKTLQAELAKA